MDRIELERQVRAALQPHLAPGSGKVPAAELAGQIARFCGELAAANEHLNLTAITDPQRMAVLHGLDSLTAVPLLAGCRSLLDLGSGGGLPGIPLALALPGLQVTLAESRERKAAALAQIVEALGLAPRVQAVHARGEAWLADHSVDAVVARAVDTLPRLLKSLRPVRRSLQRLILMKGPAADAELAALGRRRLAALGWLPPERHEASLPGEAGRRVLLVLRPAAERAA